jgi:PAS domain S-box-containing protein
VKFLTNPIFLKLVLVLFASGFVFVIATILMRRIRKSFDEEAALADSPRAGEQLPLHTYHAVIQELKQQKHELLALQQAEYGRAFASENISAAVLSNLSSGVLFFGANGLVRQANHAAKTILGIASPAGMDAETVFRPSVAGAVKAVLRPGSTVRRQETDYMTPGGERRTIEITASRVTGTDGAVLGVACLINDGTEIAEIRRQIDLRGEMSAEMALALRASLVTISGYAQRLAQNGDPGEARQLASDIADEAKLLDHTIGGFLAEDKKAKTTAATC